MYCQALIALLGIIRAHIKSAECKIKRERNWKKTLASHHNMQNSYLKWKQCKMHEI